jgi:CRP/FNR family transcriptional regulator, cyclic AMP receptor protein
MEATGLGKVYGDGDIIVRQGEVGDCVYMILGGQVEVTYEKDGKEIQLTALGPGDFLGEMALLGPNIRSATARAMGEVRVLTIHKNTFLRRVHEDPSICLNMMRKMSRRIKELGDDLVRCQKNSGTI